MPVSINGSGAITFNDGSVQNTAGFAPFRNRLINSDMRIDQRNNGASVANGGYTYFLDRWVGNNSQSSRYTVQQNAGSVTPPTGFVNYLGVTSSSAYTVGSGETFGIQQRIEGVNVADLGWGTANASSVTLSFWVRSSLTGTHSGSFYNSDFTRGYAFTFTVGAANTWEQKTVTVAGDTSGTWLTTNGVGIVVNFNLASGSTLSRTAGSWGAGCTAATGALSVLATNGATFYITGVQLEKGTVATPFEVRPYATELALCQRYYELCTLDRLHAIYLNNGVGVNRFEVQPRSFAVVKRANPTMAIKSGTIIWALPGTNAFSASSNTGVNFGVFTDVFWFFHVRQAGGGTPTQPDVYVLENTVVAEAAAEL